MPFRVTYEYSKLPVAGRDPTADELREYVRWLRAELAVAEAALAALADRPAEGGGR